MIKKGSWYSIKVCTSCGTKLNESQRMYGGGICNHCGYDSRSTICDTNNVIIRKVKCSPWWNIINPKIAYEGRNEFSREWLEDKGMLSEIWEGHIEFHDNHEIVCRLERKKEEPKMLTMGRGILTDEQNEMLCPGMIVKFNATTEEIKMLDEKDNWV